MREYKVKIERTYTEEQIWEFLRDHNPSNWTIQQAACEIYRYELGLPPVDFDGLSFEVQDMRDKLRAITKAAQERLAADPPFEPVYPHSLANATLECGAVLMQAPKDNPKQ